MRNGTRTTPRPVPLAAILALGPADGWQMEPPLSCNVIHADGGLRGRAVYRRGPGRLFLYEPEESTEVVGRPRLSAVLEGGAGVSGRHWVYRERPGGVPTLTYSTRRKPRGGAAAAGYWAVLGAVAGLLLWLVSQP